METFITIRIDHTVLAVVVSVVPSYVPATTAANGILKIILFFLFNDMFLKKELLQNYRVEAISYE